MLYVGTCGFSESIKKYFANYKTIEIQQTFYKILKDTTLIKWKKLAPKDFVFNFKAFQGITHPPTSPTWRKSNLKSLKHVGWLQPTKQVYKFWKKMLNYQKILDAKVIVIQLPSSFKDEPKNWDNAEKFFSKIDRGDFEIGVELRMWKEESVRKFCKKFDLIDVCDINVRLPTIKKYISYFRLHGAYKNGRINYSYKYTKKDLEKILKRIKKIGSEYTFVMFNNLYMRDDSKKFIRMIKGR